MGDKPEESKEHFDIFLSHNSKDKPAVIELADALELRGLKPWLDLRELAPGSDWQAELELVIRTIPVAAVIVGRDGLGPWEDPEMKACLNQFVKRKLKVIPILLPGVEEKPDLPIFLENFTWLDLRDGHTDESLNNLVWGITGRKPERKKEPCEHTANGKPKIYFSRQWPVTDPDLFGRDAELALLDEAWSENQLNIVALVAAGGVGKTALTNRWRIYHLQPHHWRGAARVYGWSFYSQGATEGRHSSTDTFLDHALRWFGDDETADSTRAAYDKGMRLAELVRAVRTLLLLDGAEPLQEPPGPAAAHPGQIQDPGLKGLLKGLALANPGLCVVSTRMAVADLKPYTAAGGTVRSVDLDNLSPESGAAYLRSLSVDGADKELRKASKEFGNHALALTLLGHFLARYHQGDVRRRDEIGPLLKEKRFGGHAGRVMAWYSKTFADTPEGDLLHVLGLFDRPADPGAVQALREGAPIEGVTARLHGLSDADWTDALENLREARLLAREERGGGAENANRVAQASRLSDRILGHPNTGETPVPPYSRTPEGAPLDCHPLVREYFGARLKEDLPEAWKAAHNVLYEYYQALPAKDLPDTIEEMAPLFQAVLHGCHAGRHQEALDEVYYSRIQRDGQTNYCCNELGAFGADLSALAGFFDPPWRQSVAGITEADQAFVLTSAAFRLRALGRLAEAVAPMEAGLKNNIRRSDWENAATQAGNLSELSLTLGSVAAAVDYAERSVGYADDSGNEFQRMVARTKVGDARHQAGRLADAGEAFREAEAMQAEWQPVYPLLYSLQGFLYCDLILARGDAAVAQRRARQTLEWAKTQGTLLLTIALEHLTLGRAALALAREAGSADFAGTAEELDAAVAGLRLAGRQDHLPRGLLARAELYRLQRDFTRTRQDLDEAWDIATRGGMRLFECDIHLECTRVWRALADRVGQPSRLSRQAERLSHAADGPDDADAPPDAEVGLEFDALRLDSPFRLYLDTPDGAEPGPALFLRAARGHLAEAQRLVDETGYHRRDPELLLETAYLEFLEGQRDAARETLAKAKARIDEMGYHSLDIDMRELEALLASPAP